MARDHEVIVRQDEVIIGEHADKTAGASTAAVTQVVLQ
jgi:hypothetical protein